MKDFLEYLCSPKLHKQNNVLVKPRRFEAYRHDVPLAQFRSAWMSSRRSRDHTCAPLSRPPCRSCAVCEARLHGFPSLPPSALQMVQRWQAATLTASLSLSAPLSRDDLFRVELDSVAGDEMFYSKVSRSQLDTAWCGCTAEFPLGPLEGCESCLNILCFSFTEENMGVEQERYQDLQDEGQARGETVQRFLRFLFHSKISLFHLANLPSTEF